MGTKAIPQSFLHVCDGCGTEVANAMSARPKYWADLVMHQDQEWADGTVRWLLCEKCAQEAKDAVSVALKKG